MRTIDLASKRRDQEEEQRRDSEKEKDAESMKVERSSIFGSAKPVDTSAREKEIEERLKKESLIKAPINSPR